MLCTPHSGSTLLYICCICGYICGSSPNCANISALLILLGYIEFSHFTRKCGAFHDMWLDISDSGTSPFLCLTMWHGNAGHFKMWKVPLALVARSVYRLKHYPHSKKYLGYWTVVPCDLQRLHCVGRAEEKLHFEGLFWDVFLLVTVVKNGYLSYCRFPLSSNCSGCSLVSVISTARLLTGVFLTLGFGLVFCTILFRLMCVKITGEQQSLKYSH